MVSEKVKVWFWRPVAQAVAVLGITPLVLKLIGTPIPALADIGLDKWILAIAFLMLTEYLMRKWK